MDNPEYSVKIQIIDEQTGEIVAQETALISNEKMTGEPVLGIESLIEESAEGAFWKLMRRFRNGGQQQYEKDNYSDAEEAED